MSTFVIDVSKYVWERKTCGPTILLECYIQHVFPVGQMLSHTLDNLYFCAISVEMNALKKFQKILEMVKFFVVNNFRRH